MKPKKLCDRILSKRDFADRYRKGEFGNASPTWDSVQEFIDHYEIEWPRDDELFHLRNKSPGAKTYYNVTYSDIRALRLDEDLSGYYVSAMAPTNKTLIQGEVKLSPRHVELRYTKVKKPMREALAESERTIFGLTALQTLKLYLDANSYEWLFYLLDFYPDHIVEFSTYSTNWGTVPSYNTVFWEIRPDRGFGSNTSQFTEIY